jgi:dTMP kinase
MTLRRGSVVVFEGLDKAGKSSQLDLLRDILDPSSVLFAHMPSGQRPFTRTVYDVLEDNNKRPISGLSIQLAHLSCHAESMEDLKLAVDSKALVLDRWWWSTLAYGWFGGSVEQSGISLGSFRELIDVIWSPITPALNFVFLEPHQVDSNNNEGVEVGYHSLISEYSDVSIIVPRDTTERTHKFIVGVLRERNLISD